METDHQEQVALHRWAVIAEATSDRLSPPSAGARAPDRFSRPRGPDGRIIATHAQRSTAGYVLALRRPRCLEAHTTRDTERCAHIRSCS